MVDFNDMFKELKDLILPLAKDTVEEYKDEAVEDGKAFLSKIKDDLARWITQLEKGEISEDDLKWLVEGKKDLAEMVLLKQKGLAMAKIGKFQKGLFNLVVTTVVSKLGS